MRRLLDEQLSPEIAVQLQRRGHDVLSVAEAGVRGQEDAGLLTWASSQQRAVFTNNIRDFGPLHANYLSGSATHYGIILLPSSKFSLRMDSLGEVVSALDRLLAEHPHPAALLVDARYSSEGAKPAGENRAAYRDGSFPVVTMYTARCIWR